MSSLPDQLLIGAHTSIAGGVHNALLQGKEIGATTVQIFTSNQRQWKGRPLPQEALDLWQKTLSETNIKEIMSHDSYLINLGSPDPEILEKSRLTFREEIERCKQLGITYLNFHPGASKNCDAQKCLDTICDSLIGMQDLLDNSSLRLLLECTAGQGSAVGYRFEELAYILSKIENRLKVGVCIDTCHIFVAGYDIRTAADWEKTLNEFDHIIGIKKLFAFHLNDSLKDLGSRVDRHAPIGQGKIGLESFKFLMQDKRTRELPKYLETPDGVELWKKEIPLLRNLGAI